MLPSRTCSNLKLNRPLMVLTTDSGCSKISFYMKELKLPFMICWIPILRKMSRPVSTNDWKAAKGLETTTIVVWVSATVSNFWTPLEMMALLWNTIPTNEGDKPKLWAYPKWSSIHNRSNCHQWIKRLLNRSGFSFAFMMIRKTWNMMKILLSKNKTTRKAAEKTTPCWKAWGCLAASGTGGSAPSSIVNTKQSEIFTKLTFCFIIQNKK